MNEIKETTACGGLNSEQKRILSGFNNTKSGYDRSATIHGLFEKQAERDPDKPALVFKDTQMNYRTLNHLSNQLARYLVKKNIRKNIIGIMPSRSFGMFVGMLAILKSGNAYLPIDHEYPQKRIEYLLENSRTPLLLSNKEVIDKFDNLRFSGGIIDINDDDLYTGEKTNQQIECDATDLAYLIYTSGSTGRPKGVMIEHRAVSNFIHAITEKIRFSESDIILALTTISFDIFVLESLLALAAGLTIVIATEKDQKNHKLLNELVIRNRVNILQITPSHLDLLLSDPHNIGFLKSLTHLLIGGEALPQSVLNKLKEQYAGKIYNMYGPTETTVWSMIKDLTDRTDITIGSPIANTQVYILDEHHQPAAIGEPGELCIAGDGLARGYFNLAELTDEKFVPNPFNPGTKMYRTGDLGTWLPEGEVQFLGRIDNQVKIKGHRIEPEEIESTLQKYSLIQSALVIVKCNEKDDRFLAAFYVSREEIPEITLRNFLKEELTEHMIPSVFVRLDKIPLTPNGKKDRQSARTLAFGNTIDDDQGVCNDEIESRVIKILSESTESNTAINEKNFQSSLRDIGIDSFAFTKALITIENEFGIDFGFEEMDMNNFRTARQFTDYLIQEIRRR